MSAHTPGPWEYRPGMFDDWGVVRCTAGFICQALNPEISFAQKQVHRSAKTDPAEANARLIAAAPDMYEALKVAPNPHSYENPDDYCAASAEWFLLMRNAALAKAGK